MQSHTYSAAPAAPRRIPAPMRRLRPLLQHCYSVGNEQLRRELAGQPADECTIACLTLAPEIVVTLVYDNANVSHTTEGQDLLSHADLQRAKLPREQAFKTAIRNLIAAEDQWAATHVGGVIISGTTDAYNAARLLALYPHNRPSSLTPSPLVVMVPEPNTLLCASRDDERALCDMVRLSEHRFAASDQRISGQPLIWADGHWQPFVPARRLTVFDKLKLACTAAHYREQQPLLAQWFNRQKRKDHVAEIHLQVDPYTRECYSSADWVFSKSSLLPQVDRVNFYGEGNQWLGWATWNEVQQVLPARMELFDCTPPRWRTTGFPGAAQQRALSLSHFWPHHSYTLQ